MCLHTYKIVCKSVAAPTILILSFLVQYIDMSYYTIYYLNKIKKAVWVNIFNSRRHKAGKERLSYFWMQCLEINGLDAHKNTSFHTLPFQRIYLSGFCWTDYTNKPILECDYGGYVNELSGTFVWPVDKRVVGLTKTWFNKKLSGVRYVRRHVNGLSRLRGNSTLDFIFCFVFYFSRLL